MVEHAFHNTQADHCVFVKRYDGGDFLILLLYVEDMLIVGQDAKKIAITDTPTMDYDGAQMTRLRLIKLRTWN